MLRLGSAQARLTMTFFGCFFHSERTPEFTVSQDELRVHDTVNNEIR